MPPDTSSQKALRVFILSAYPLFGNGAEVLLREKTPVDIVGRESDVDRALCAIELLKPDVAILESSGPTFELASAVQHILRASEKTRIIGFNPENNEVSIFHVEIRVIRTGEDFFTAVIEL